MSTLTLEVLEVFTVKQGGQVMTCTPGARLQLPREQAQRVLDRVGDRVRIIEAAATDPVIEPAASDARPVYWESGRGQILGPAVVEYLARVESEFWIVVRFEDTIRWVRSDRLRTDLRVRKEARP